MATKTYDCADCKRPITFEGRPEQIEFDEPVFCVMCDPIHASLRDNKYHNRPVRQFVLVVYGGDDNMKPTLCGPYDENTVVDECMQHEVHERCIDAYDFPSLTFIRSR